MLLQGRDLAVCGVEPPLKQTFICINSEGLPVKALQASPQGWQLLPGWQLLQPQLFVQCACASALLQPCRASWHQINTTPLLRLTVDRDNSFP